jgi:hypothetical protein
MKRLLLTTLLILSITNRSFAEDSVFIEKNQPAPFAGFLLPKDKGNKVAQDLLELEADRKLIESFTKTLKLYDSTDKFRESQLDILFSQNDKLSKELKEAHTTTNFERVVWVGLGVLATGLAIYGAKQITR